MARILRLSMFRSVFLSLLLNQASTQDHQKGSDGNNWQGRCIVRDGRDGIPGSPGYPGRPGTPGRDGRDCTINWSLTTIFEMDKRLRELDSKLELLEKKVEEMKEELEASTNQGQQLLGILAAKKILDEETVILKTTYGLIPAPGEADTKLSPTKFILLDQKTTTSPPVLTSSPKPSVNENSKEDCQKRLAFYDYDKVETRGAVSIEPFNLNGNILLAVANFHVDGDGYYTDSFIYKMNPTTLKFEILQTLPTTGCRSMTFVSDRGESYLVAANHFDGKSHVMDAFVYKWNGTKFVNFTKANTSGASTAQFFKIDGESFLAFANYRNDTSVSINSVVYKWKRNGKLEVFQKLPTHGAVDCKFHRSKTGNQFLAFANYYSVSDGFNVKSVVYIWNGRRFVFAQNVEASAAMCVDLFEGEAGLFLVLASHRTLSSWHSHTNVYLWNGTAFVLFQELATTAAVKVRHFKANGTLYLTIANYFDEITNFETYSMVYKFKDGRFVKFQGIPTTGAYDLQPFTYRGSTYLAAAFRFNGVNGRLKSKIYKMHKGCIDGERAWP